MSAASAVAYVGDSFLSIAGTAGHWQGDHHKNWIRVEANEWGGVLTRLNSGTLDPLAGDKLHFGGPSAARPGGPGELTVALAKADPDVAVLMSRCHSKASIPEMLYAESSDRSRPTLELGPRPREFADFWEFKLKDVAVTMCPEVEGAIHQAFVMTYRDIEWLNYDPKRPMTTRIVVTPQDLPDVKPAVRTSTQKVKAFLITWIAPATDAAEDQCPVMNPKPTDADYYRYMSKEEAAKERERLGPKGFSFGLESEKRGPNRLNVARLPGIVPDPGFYEPQSKVAYGVNLDGDDGSGAPPPGTCKHKNYVAADGRTGIDNQYHTVMGCVTGYRGKKGYSNQTPNARRADGNVTTLIQISGIEDERNDDSVDVAIIFSMDKPVRDNAGKSFIPNYSFRPTTDPNFALYNMRVRGRMVNGVVTTDVMPQFQTNLGQPGLLELFQARMRFEPLPDGSMKGFLAGYHDWRDLAGGSGYGEGLFAYQVPGQFYALKRNADGLKDPVTGECNGISIVYEMDTVPAFLTSAPPKVADAGRKP